MLNAAHRHLFDSKLEVADLLLELERDPLGRPVADAGAIRAGIPAWHPRNDDDAGKGDDDDDDDDAAGKGDDDDDDDGKGDDDDDDVTKARKAAAAANRELRKIKAEQAKAAEKSKAEAGKWQELAEERERELAELRSEQETAAKRALAIAALAKAKAKNPDRAVRMLDLEDIEDETDAERAVKRLLKSDDYLFEAKGPRQKRGAGASSDDDDDDEGDKPKRPVNRLRRGLEATAGG